MISLKIKKYYSQLELGAPTGAHAFSCKNNPGTRPGYFRFFKSSI